ncbi:sigma-70 family RNA polymerase sigma factor [Actinobacillus minor]|uniref:sigma-70 family RNA polymerase sigma factor n=1 Tax=Actinobacillus minor TaxID=51047 RepID=UPI0026F115A9|nr:sigma-70 family RNA polymerase sigma factor [Actinobacillus minor]
MEKLTYITEMQIEEIRQQMLKFAILQLNDFDLAEEVVQEAFVSAYKNAQSFRGKAALKTWIFAILKYKIIDAINQKKRLISVSEFVENNEQSIFFDHTGYWILDTYDPKEWEDVSHLTYKEEFWTIFDLCLNHLPAQQARIFMMREHLELSTTQICQECEISISNLHVILHRARLQLQSCLSKHWFGEY